MTAKHDKTRHNKKEQAIFATADKADLQKRYDLIQTLAALKKAQQMYGQNNDFVQTALREAMNPLRYFFIEQNRLSIIFDGYDIVINGDRLKKKRKMNDAMDTIAEIHRKFSLREIVFLSGIRDENLLTFFDLVHSFRITKTDANYFEALMSSIRERKIPVELTEREASAGEEFFSIADKPQMARLVYRKMVNDLGMFRQKIEQNKPLPMRKALRHIQNLIDLLSDTSDDSQRTHLLVLATLNSLNRNYIDTHSVNVTILVTATGIILDIDRDYLLSMGLSAYVHDIGLDLNEYVRTVKAHHELGFAFLSRLNSLNFSMMESALTAAYHHSSHSFNAGVFPREKRKRSLLPAEEVLKICDFYSIITTWWPHRAEQPLDHVSAMEKVLAVAQKKIFIPVVARAFFNTLGIYPPGTIVLHRTHEMPAFSFGGLSHTDASCTIGLLDDDLALHRIETVRGTEIFRAPEQIHFRLPPETIKDIFDYFQTDDDN